MKKILTLLLAAAMCFSLIACSDEPNSAENTNAGETADNTTTENNLPPEPDEEPEDTGTGESKPQYTIIELTVENWDTYFEVVEVAYFLENAFGEAYRLHIQHYYKLKDEYSKMSGTETNIAIQYSYTMGYRECIVDFENKDFTLGTEYMDGYSVRTITATEEYFRYLDRIGTFGVEAGCECSCGKGETAVVDQYCANFQIIRVQGQLCLEK